MTPQEDRIVSLWGEGIGDPILLGVVWKEDEPGRKIRAFCEALRPLVPQLRVEVEELFDESFSEIRVRENIRYRAVPEAKELEPFLKAIHSTEPLAGKLKPSLRQILRSLAEPTS